MGDALLTGFEANFLVSVKQLTQAGHDQFLSVKQGAVVLQIAADIGFRSSGPPLRQPPQVDVDGLPLGFSDGPLIGEYHPPETEADDDDNY